MMVACHANDVGYIEGMRSFIITVVSCDTAEGWKTPLDEIKVGDKAMLFQKIQETIYRYRSE
jgi:hypothetical protein